MKKTIIFSKEIDVSTRHLNFEDLKNYKLRDIVRDYFDYFIRRPIYKILYKNFFKKQDYKIDCVLPSKGFSPLSRRKKLNFFKNIENKSILNIGCGNGFDYHLWFKFNPKLIVGIDVLNYSHSWKIIRNFISFNNLITKTKFIRTDIENFQTKQKFDFIVSDAVFEHCKNFEKVAKKCSDLLKKGGFMYSSYGGPMWYNYAGDHFSGRDNKKNGFNHLILNNKEYYKYFLSNVRSIKYELYEGGGGGLLVEHDLFSKLTGNEYIKILEKYRFELVNMTVEFCPIGVDILRNNLKLKNKLLKKYININYEDLVLRTHIAYFKKK